MEALAEGAMEVLSGRSARVYDVLPDGYKTEEAFYNAVKNN